MAGSVSFTGLATGLDTNSLIERMIALERRPINALEDKQEEYESNISFLSTLETKLGDLQDLAQDMASMASFKALSATVSDESILTATVDGSSATGTMDIEVKELAKYDKWYSNTRTSQYDAATGTGTLKIRLGEGDWTEIDVLDTDSLIDIRDAINDSDADVTASIIYDGSTNYRLSVTSNNSGDDNVIEFDETGLVDLGLETGGNHIVIAQNAVVRVDDLFDVESSNNIVENLMEGLTLELEKAEIGTQVTVRVDTDLDGQVENIEDFVEKYNDVITAINDVYEPDEIGVIGGMIMDSGLRMIRDGLNSRVSQSLSDGDYTALSQIGIKTGINGKLSVDSDALRSALGDDYQGVLDIFTTEDEGVGDRFDAYIEELVKNDGILEERQESMREEIDRIDLRIDSLEAHVARFEDMLIKRFAALEQLVSELQGQGNSLSAALARLG